MLTQTLPQTARNYSKTTRNEAQAALAAMERQWRRMGSDFDASWARIAPTVLAILHAAQKNVAREADRYVPAVLAETGQYDAIVAAANVNIDEFVGVTGSGHSTADALALVPIRAKQAKAGIQFVNDDGLVSTLPGKSDSEALTYARQWMFATVGTILSDTARAVETTGMATRPVAGYVRMLVPPSCGRCAILAGQYYRKNAGFERHPGCDCRHIPVGESIAGDMTLDVNAYFNSLDEAGQVKLMGSKANAEAVRLGADPTQIVNAYRRGALKTAQGVGGKNFKYTTEGTGRRGFANWRMSGEGMRRGTVRQMPETLLRIAKDDADAVRLLRRYGWVV